MAGNHSFNKRPIYFQEEEESKLFEKTPKHVLYTLMRDYALQLFGENNISSMLDDIEDRKRILKDNHLIK